METTKARGGTLEILAVCLLLIGGALVPAIGWLAGVALLWASRAWTIGDKLLGTLVVPGGLAPALYLLFADTGQICLRASDGGETCSGGAAPLELLGLALLVIAPLATAVHLTRRMSRPG